MKGKLRVLLRLNFQVYRRQKQARNIRTGIIYIYIGGKNKQGILEQEPSIYISKGKQERNIKTGTLYKYIGGKNKQGILEQEPPIYISEAKTSKEY